LFYIEHANFSQIGYGTLLACSEMRDETALPAQLSPRQKECLQLIAQGRTASFIAFKLGISIRMVRFHMKAAREKLGAVSTPQAVHLASRLGLLDQEG